MLTLKTAQPLLAVLLAAGGTLSEEAPEELTQPAEQNLSATLSAGIDSIYVLYGYRQTEPLFHSDIWLSYPLTDRITLNAGTWYGHLTDGTYREIDLYAGADYALGGNVYLGFLYSYFDYLEAPWGDGDSNEIAAHASYWGEYFSFSLRNHYDTEAGGSLLRFVADCSAPLHDTVALKFDAETGYAFGYYIEGNAWNHAQFKASLPVQIGGYFSLTPFIAYTVPLAAIDSFEEADTYYGLSISAFF